jgi:hypothetical protein
MSSPHTGAGSRADALAVQRTLTARGETLRTVFEFPCPRCRQGIKLSIAFVGQPFLCPRCNCMVIAPGTVSGLAPNGALPPRGSWRWPRSLGPLRRFQQFLRSRMKPLLIGLAAAAIMGVGLGIAARWLWEVGR